jgi:hypothetical protein
MRSTRSRERDGVAEDDHMVEALTSDRPMRLFAYPFSKAVNCTRIA